MDDFLTTSRGRILSLRFCFWFIFFLLLLLLFVQFWSQPDSQFSIFPFSRQRHLEAKGVGGVHGFGCISLTRSYLVVRQFSSRLFIWSELSGFFRLHWPKGVGILLVISSIHISHMGASQRYKVVQHSCFLFKIWRTSRVKKQIAPVLNGWNYVKIMNIYCIYIFTSNLT